MSSRSGGGSQTRVWRSPTSSARPSAGRSRRSPRSRPASTASAGASSGKRRSSRRPTSFGVWPASTPSPAPPWSASSGIHTASPSASPSHPASSSRPGSSHPGTADRWDASRSAATAPCGCASSTIHGASFAGHTGRRADEPDELGPWALPLQARSGHTVAAVALADRVAPIGPRVWRDQRLVGPSCRRTSTTLATLSTRRPLHHPRAAAHTAGWHTGRTGEGSRR